MTLRVSFTLQRYNFFIKNIVVVAFLLRKCINFAGKLYLFS